MIEILNFKFLNKGPLIGTFTVKLQKMGGMVIRECTLFEMGDKRWVNLPSRTYEVDGKKKYFSFVIFEDRATDDKFKDLIMKSVTEYMKNLQTVAIAPEREKEFEDMCELPF